MMLLASFLMYEALWTVIEVQLDEMSFDAEETLWDFAQCVLFTSAVFIVNWGFTTFRGGRYARSLTEVGCLLVVCPVLIFIADNYIYVQETADDSFWNVVDVYIICIISTMISIIDIQHSYHERFVRMKREQMSLRLKLLQQQLSPHFMFNSLSTLQGMIASNPQKAEEYVATLSDIMRYITENIGKEKVALAEAVSFIESYTEMLNARFPGHFVFNISMEGAPGGAGIVPVSMQIAIENAIKHNNHSRKCPLEISITLDGYAVVVSNRKQPVASADSLGVGLKNLSERYRLMTGKELDVKETAEYYSVRIPVLRT